MTNAGSTNGRWIYDDTNPDHALSTDNSRILQAASGRTYGYELMARRQGFWRKLNPNGVVTRFFAEIYSGEFAIDDYFSVWQANPSIGRPMINIGRATNAQISAAVLHLCRSASSGTYIGMYSSQPVDASNGKLTTVQNALNTCTTG